MGRQIRMDWAYQEGREAGREEGYAVGRAEGELIGQIKLLRDMRSLPPLDSETLGTATLQELEERLTQLKQG